MKKYSIIMLLLSVVVLSFYSCGDDDGPEGGKAAKYQVIIKQSGDYLNYSKAVVIAANGSTLKDDITGNSLSKTVFNDEDLAGAVFSVSTETEAIQFAVSGRVIDKDEEVVSGPMTWDVTVKKNGKEIDRQTMEFKDGHSLSDPHLELYYE